MGTQLEDNPWAPAGSDVDSKGRVVIRQRRLDIGTEVEVGDKTGIVVGRQGALYNIHIPGEYGGDECDAELDDMVVLERAVYPLPAPAEGSTAINSLEAIRISHLEEPFTHLNGIYKRMGVTGTGKFELHHTSADVSSVWRDPRTARWRLANSEDITQGWLFSSPTILGHWSPDPSASDATCVAGTVYPYISRADSKGGM
eukprot:TRINITY_DN16956_c0_g1_i1.p1 TRINITY_DN16956_c0_g1~~TRINITY_DN16956_c0_g1_i1.p1  ORF type:complete len:207 (+),score=28.51 TRINITY_DN16956_c0_g1_i1:23-622(+)